MTADTLHGRIELLEATNRSLVEAVAARDQFLSVVAHELRNPMTPIVARVSMLKRLISRANGSPVTLTVKLDEIEWLITMFMKRVTMLLDVSRMTSGKLRLTLVPVDVSKLAGLVCETFAPLAQYAGASLTMDASDDPLVVLGDPLSLEQVLDNLVSNAIKYGSGTPIVVRTFAGPTGGTACVSVADGGSGISRQAQDRIFEHFERAVRPGEMAGGFGVGLWIVRQLSEAMGGSIAVTCPAEGGSVFTVTLPLAPQDQDS